MWWNTGTGGFTFYKDGAKYLTVEPAQLDNWCFSSGVPMSMILNLAIGGGQLVLRPTVRSSLLTCWLITSGSGNTAARPDYYVARHRPDAGGCSPGEEPPG